MKNNYFSILFAITISLLILLPLSIADAVGSKPGHKVIILSIDGLGPKGLELAAAPNIKRWRERGAVAPRARAILPAKTMTNHASQISGVGLKKHWMLSNGEFGFEMTVPSIFDLAEMYNLKTAMVASKRKFLRMVKEDKLDYAKIVYDNATIVAQHAVEVIKKLQPDVMWIHFRDVDNAGHKFGWLSPTQMTAIEEADRGFGILVNALQETRFDENTTVILTSDHSGHGYDHMFNAEDRPIMWYAVGPEVPAGSIIRGDVFSYDTARMAAHFIGLEPPVNWQWDGRVLPLETR
jgi:predicted AlkP superfamily pyrophosphatase or phosphodiesterase